MEKIWVIFTDENVKQILLTSVTPEQHNVIALSKGLKIKKEVGDPDLAFKLFKQAYYNLNMKYSPVITDRYEEIEKER